MDSSSDRKQPMVKTCLDVADKKDDIPLPFNKVPTVPGRARIEYILRKGYSSRGSFFTVRRVQNKTDHMRFVVIASKKVSKHATVRNRARRRAHEALRILLPKLPKIGYDVIILVNNKVLDTPFEKLQQELTNFLS